MMLVGFCILKKNLKYDGSRLFPMGVNVIHKSIKDHILYLYGYGSEYEGEIEDKTYRLYPGALDQRNIHVQVCSDCVEIKADWLGSFPCYYDEISQEIASHWGMLDLTTREHDYVGSYILKKYSFIPTSRTVKQGVRRLLSGECLAWSADGGLRLRASDFSINRLKPTLTADVVTQIEERLKRDGLGNTETIVPLSGGYDSRFLASIIKSKFAHDFKSFTYSLLGPEGDCFESKVSKNVANKLDSSWTSFDLTGYARYEETIIDWSGGFSHVNGDYYEMFAEQVVRGLEPCCVDSVLLVSGIVGDLWCGKVNPNHLKIKPSNFLYSHGISTYKWMISAMEDGSSMQAEDELNEFFSQRIDSEKTAILELVRAKVALLSFLCYSFEKRGVRCSAPFLDKGVVEAVLNLNPVQRLDRKWQDIYFKEFGLADSQLPKILLKINRLAVNEGSKKNYHSLEKMKLHWLKNLLLKILLSKGVRKIELALTRHKVSEYALRKLRYRRSDVLISIINVLTK